MHTEYVKYPFFSKLRQNFANDDTVKGFISFSKQKAQYCLISRACDARCFLLLILCITADLTVLAFCFYSGMVDVHMFV